MNGVGASVPRWAMAYLTIRIKGEEGYRRVPLDKDRMVLGRSSACELLIPSTAVSREHCAFVREGEQWLVEDLGSSNGTRIGERKVDGRAPLAEKDLVKAGVARCTFHLGPIPNADEASEPTEEAAPTRTRGADDPQDAIPCSDCGKWMSIAHRLPGERMPCPFCEKRQTVPTLIS